MLKEYAFSVPSGAKRANDVPHLAKAGAGCQTEMNRALREAATGMPLTAENLAAVVTKAVAKASRRPVAT